MRIQNHQIPSPAPTHINARTAHQRTVARRVRTMGLLLVLGRGARHAHGLAAAVDKLAGVDDVRAQQALEALAVVLAAERLHAAGGDGLVAHAARRRLALDVARRAVDLALDFAVLAVHRGGAVPAAMGVGGQRAASK